MNFTNTDSAWVELWDDMHDDAYWRVVEHLFHFQNETDLLLYDIVEDKIHSITHKIFMELSK